MRYWLCVRGLVTGPFTPAELAGEPDFCGSALVCPEERSDRPRPWARASSFGELRRHLPADYHLAVPGGGREPAWLPPDPTIGDAAAARSLEAGIRGLEERLVAALERNRRNAADQAALKRDIRRKESAFNALRRVLSALSERLQALSGMHEALRLTQERIGSQGTALTEFRRRLHDIRLETAAALTTAEQAARRAADDARSLVDEAKGQVDAALRTAAEALDAASRTEARADAAERLAREQSEAAARKTRPARARNTRKKPPPPDDLGFPDSTPIDGL